jgi:hypothetical protein
VRFFALDSISGLSPSFTSFVQYRKLLLTRIVPLPSTSSYPYAAAPRIFFTQPGRAASSSSSMGRRHAA